VLSTRCECDRRLLLITLGSRLCLQHVTVTVIDGDDNFTCRLSISTIVCAAGQSCGVRGSVEMSFLYCLYSLLLCTMDLRTFSNVTNVPIPMSDIYLAIQRSVWRDILSLLFVCLYG